MLDGGLGQPEIVIGNGPGGHPRVRVIYWPPAGLVHRGFRKLHAGEIVR